MTAATPLRPRLEANAAGIGHISLNPGAVDGRAHGAAFPQRRRAALSQPRALKRCASRRAPRPMCWPAPRIMPNTITLVKIGEFVAFR